jgi:signal transduction histidine kinase/ActR/RegA family two-component response regulator
MRGPSTSRLLDYLFALAVTAGAVLVRASLPWLGNFIPLGPMTLAVALSMWRGGLGPAIVSVIVGYLTCDYLFIEPVRSLAIADPREYVRLAMYLISCATLIGFWEAMRRANRRLQDALQQQRSIEDSLRGAEQQLQLVADSMAAPVARCGRDLRYLWVSHPYAQGLHRDAEDIVGRPIEEVIGHEAFRRLLPHFERVLAGHEVRYEDQVDFQGIGPRWIQAVYTPTYDERDVPDGWVAVVIDVDERKRNEDALKQADRQKDEFLATLAHELRNPLAPVRNATQILRIKGPFTPEIEWARDVIDRQMQHMTRLVDDLMDVSRITRNRVELRRERVALARILHGAVETSRPLIDAMGHALTVNLPADPIELEADVTRLAQVFSNLLNNAAKFTERGGRIVVTAERQGSDVVVTVSDNGIGLPNDMLTSIFDLFTQVDRSLERSRAGLGIGLTMVKRLVEMHGGSVTASSEGLGRGSTFVVRLPVPIALATWTAESASEGPLHAESAGRRVLVVDDNDDAATSLSLLLGSLGYETRTAGDGEAALRVAEDFRPDAMLLDIGLPRLNGYDVARALRARPWGKDVTLIAVTGWGQAEDRQRTMAAGFDEHMVKPVDPDVLLRRLRSLPRSAPSASLGAR